MYGINGNTITTPYNVDGDETSSAYDIGGNSIFELEPVLLSDIPVYFQTDVVNALNYVDSLGNDYAHYIVITDTHYSLNYAKSPDICNYMYSTGKFDKMIHLGDFLESGPIGGDNWNAMIEADFCHYKKWLITQGNHDAGIYPFSDALPYFESNGVNYVNHSYHNGFYYDNEKHKIRFIGLHHMLHGNSVIREEIEGFISSIPDDYKWCIINHYPMLVIDGLIRTDCMVEDVENWLLGLIETYPNFIGLFCGHLHEDHYTLANSGTKEFHHTVFDADIKRSGLDGTTDEQVVTIVSINPTTENVKFYRIGRSVVHESKQWEYTGFTK